jgi:hypothetical protein
VTSEQRVRTEAGWIGVEISRSRVRTAGKAGYGLYRVRGSEHIAGGRSAAAPVVGGAPVHWMAGEWTGYLFTLDEIERQVDNAIHGGTPDRPDRLMLVAGDGVVTNVPTRWTSAYRGARDLGVLEPVRLRPEAIAEVSAVAALVDAGLVVMQHEPGCACRGTEAMTMACVRLTAPTAYMAVQDTVRTRQREANAEFQAEHKTRRDAGLRQRHARKLSRRGTRATGNGEDADSARPAVRLADQNTLPRGIGTVGAPDGSQAI